MLLDSLSISDIEYLTGVSKSRIKTMRARGQTAMWDTTDDADLSEVEGLNYRNYTITDAASLACVVDLISKGLSASVAASAIANCRSYLFNNPHFLDQPRHDDIWVGLLLFNEGAAHVGGPLPSVLREVQRRIVSDIENYVDGGGSGLFLVNASNHYRVVLERFNDANRD